MRIRTKFLLSLTLVFLVVSVPFCQAAVTVEVGDKLELDYTMKEKTAVYESKGKGKLFHVVTKVDTIDGKIQYTANHTMMSPYDGKNNSMNATMNVTSFEATHKFFTKQSDIDAMSEGDKYNIVETAHIFFENLLWGGRGLIADKEYEFSLSIKYKDDGGNVTTNIEGIWGKDGRMQYFKIESLDEDPNGWQSVREIGNKSTIPGYPIVSFLGMSIMTAIFIVMKKFRKVE